MHRLYEYEDIAVFWDSEKCRHAKRCVQRRPWIDLTQAPAMEIWQTIEKCPTGALSCVYTHDISVEFDPDNSRCVAVNKGQQVGECDYKKTEEGWIIYHTEVMPEHEGRGIAKRLVYRIVEAAEKEGMKVIPTCSYAAKVLGK